LTLLFFRPLYYVIKPIFWNCSDLIFSIFFYFFFLSVFFFLPPSFFKPLFDPVDHVVVCLPKKCFSWPHPVTLSLFYPHNVSPAPYFFSHFFFHPLFFFRPMLLIECKQLPLFLRALSPTTLPWLPPISAPPSPSFCFFVLFILLIFQFSFSFPSSVFSRLIPLVPTTLFVILSFLSHPFL